MRNPFYYLVVVSAVGSLVGGLGFQIGNYTQAFCFPAFETHSDHSLDSGIFEGPCKISNLKTKTGLLHNYRPSLVVV